MNLDIFWPKHIPSSNITVSSFENRAWTNVSVLVKCCSYLYFFLLCAVKKLLPLHILTLTCSKSVNIFLKSTCWGQKDLVSVLKVNYIYNLTYLYLFICTINIRMDTFCLISQSQSYWTYPISYSCGKISWTSWIVLIDGLNFNIGHFSKYDSPLSQLLITLSDIWITTLFHFKSWNFNLSMASLFINYSIFNNILLYLNLCHQFI